MCACRDLSRGKTLWHILHLMALVADAPFTIKLEILSALGLPLFSRSASVSGDPQELAGLSEICCALSPQFHGYIIAVSGGLVGVLSSIFIMPFTLFGEEKSGFSTIFMTNSTHSLNMSTIDRTVFPSNGKNKLSRVICKG